MVGKLLGIWLGMAALLLLSYGLLLDYPYRMGWLPKELGGLIVLAMAAGFVWWGVRLTRRTLAERRTGRKRSERPSTFRSPSERRRT